VLHGGFGPESKEQGQGTGRFQEPEQLSRYCSRVLPEVNGVYRQYFVKLARRERFIFFPTWPAVSPAGLRSWAAMYLRVSWSIWRSDLKCTEAAGEMAALQINRMRDNLTSGGEKKAIEPER